MEQKTHFTILISNANLAALKDDDPDYLVLASKPIWYSDEYSVAEIMILSEDPSDYDPEIILNTLGGLVYHEDATYGFLMLEDDADEVAGIYCWDNAASVLMGDLLTIGDKTACLMRKRQEVAPYATDVYVAVDEKKDEYKNIKEAAMVVFSDESCAYRFGITGPKTDIWWPCLLDEEGGYYFIIKNKIPKPEQAQLPLLPAPKHSILPPGKYYCCDDYDDLDDDVAYDYWRRGLI